MLLLTSTSDKIQVVTTGTANTDVQASFVDNNAGTITPGRTNTAISSAATTDIVAAPASSTQRNIKSLTIRNKHASASQTVTVKHTDGTTAVELFSCTLLAGEHLIWTDGRGFITYDSAGGQKSVGRTGRYLRSTLLTSASANFTTGPDTNTIVIRGVAGGGQGGGCTVGSASISGGAGGGAAGGYVEKTFAVTPNTAYAYTCGAGGSSSAAGATTGQAGANSTFIVGATTVTANGGPGGIGCTSAATVVTLGGDKPAVSTNGDVNSSGDPGGPGFVSAVGVAVSGKGGSSKYGAGGNALKTQGTGNAANGNGAGGGGGCTISTTGAVAGGAGTGGCWVVDEFA